MGRAVGERILAWSEQRSDGTRAGPVREACFCGAMGKGFREEMASEDAGRISERRILLTMYEELLRPTLGHVHQDLAEKTSRGAMPGTDVLCVWGGP